MKASLFKSIKVLIFAMAPMPMIPFKETFVWLMEVIASDNDGFLSKVMRQWMMSYDRIYGIAH